MPHILKEIESLRRIAVIGNYMPRRCGIATFTTDLCQAMAFEAPDARIFATAVNDVPQGYPYPSTVRFEIEQNNLQDYRLAAGFLNTNQFDLVCLQHEYGIFGGDGGSHILILLRELRMPIITTLHTVLKAPSDEQRIVLKELARLSDRLVIMSEQAAVFLREVYGVPESKIALIHHGIPDVPFVDPNYYKDLLGVEGRRVILTFGLLSPGKGIEYMIEALPNVVQEHPDVVYIILGATHPHIKRASGREYRVSLQTKALDLGLQDHVMFHNRFVDLEELCEFLGAADVYVTPYINEAQIVSGSLAYALGSGKAVISTPYWYAKDMLAGDRGRLVPFRSPEDLASECIHMFNNEVERHAMRKRAYTYCRQMIWKEVSRRYLGLFAEVRAERRRTPRAFKPHTLEVLGAELPEIKLTHLQLLTDDTGLLQYAELNVPDRLGGYRTDDNVRALMVVAKASRFLLGDPSLETLAARYLSFVRHALKEENGHFPNLMSYDRRWTGEIASDDSHGCVVWALGVASAWGQDRGVVGLSSRLFHQALGVLEKVSCPRAWALGLVGINSYLGRFHGDSQARRALEVLGERLHNLFKEQATDDWPWPEESLSYANAKLPHALLLAGHALRRPEMTELALRSLDWLVRIQTGAHNCFSPVGTRGWYRRGGTKAHFDQQPLEAQAMVEACIAANHITGEERWVIEAWRCFEWFLGRNELRLPLYDFATGGCRDAIHSDRVSESEGAESTLAWLLSLLAMYHHRSETALAKARQSSQT